MSSRSFEIGRGVTVGGDAPLLVAGPCVIESERLCLEIGQRLKKTCAELGIQYVFKASWDKANRTSLTSFRGPGLDKGCRILESVARTLEVPILTDVHEVHQVESVARVADVIQIPALLCRQTDLLVEAGRTGRTVNIKKGQFLAPEQMRGPIDKVTSTGNERVLITERGTTFGYGALVVDMLGLAKMREFGVPIIFDATHAVQQPGEEETGGERDLAASLMRSAAAVGVDGFFAETHPDPDSALSDGATSIPLDEMHALLESAKEIHDLVGARSADPGHRSRR
ncbi:MAG: 3-deoxy-8-phosphooctulonate synthase [Myxococcota bacterium]|nr:3-deoxy-8-phosphooctulonate synthase [Myxococcota bacterium]